MRYVDVRRRAKLKRLAKMFKKSLGGWAAFVPDDVIELISDDEAGEFFEICREIGLVQRPDGRWEEKR